MVSYKPEDLFNEALAMSEAGNKASLALQELGQVFSAVRLFVNTDPLQVHRFDINPFRGDVGEPIKTEEVKEEPQNPLFGSW